MGDDREAAEAQQVGAAVRVRVEAGAQPAGRRPDQQAAELSPRGRADLVAQLVEELLDRPLEQLQRDVAREPVGDDDVGGSAEQVARLGVAGEVEPARRQQRRAPRA